MTQIAQKLPINQIIQGDCLEVVKTLPDESVNCCVTSPPYWALRDYGTATWEGGSPDCKHIICGDDTGIGEKQKTNFGSIRIAREICPKCGAKRIDQQLGLEPTFQEYINRLCDIFDEVKRVLKKDGTVWVNIGDTYHNATKWTYTDGAQTISGGNPRDLATGRKQNQGLGEKCLLQIPSRFAIEMCNRGWILRNELIWHKPNCMPSSVKDRFTVDFEKIFFFVKSKKYYFETQYEPHAEVSIKARNAKLNQTTHIGARRSAVNVQLGNTPRGNRFIPEQGRNKRSVWRITTKPYKEAHFATYPEELCKTPIKAGCPEGGVVLDVFMGAGTTALVAQYLNRNYIGIELNPKYIEIANKRLYKAIEL